MALFEPIFAALNEAGVRYVVVGGLAVVLHGHPRLTADVDIVLDLEPAATRKAMSALKKLGLKARAPVDPAAFADPRLRESWARDKGMTVFNLYSPDNPLLSIDIFVREPMPFDSLWSRAKEVDLGQVHTRIASIEDLIAMKRAVARPQDMIDIEALEALRKDTRHG
ncbi:MAG: hypothetical protein HYZ74_04470 [Elusimicrobia bacterium]|nr:hypothetical protein [Elusimicrobiota bacterium]